MIPDLLVLKVNVRHLNDKGFHQRVQQKLNHEFMGTNEPLLSESCLYLEYQEMELFIIITPLSVLLREYVKE